eukprot:8699983-Lingulodinium_polyedra.AAC.1
MMLDWEQLIHHATDVALACNGDVHTALDCASFPAVDAEQRAEESAARPREDLLTKAILNVLDVALPRSA